MLALPSVMSDSSVTSWTVAHQAPLSLGILQARILEWVAISSSRDFPNPGIEPRSPKLQTDSLQPEPPGKPKRCLDINKKKKIEQKSEQNTTTDNLYTGKCQQTMNIYKDVISFKIKEMPDGTGEMFSPVGLTQTFRFHDTQCCLETGVGPEVRILLLLVGE